jgi:transposase
MYRCLTVILKRQQKEELVIRLAEEGKSTREIAQAVHVSLKDIGVIIRNYLGEKENETTYSGKALSMHSKAFKLFKENKNLVDVAITLNIETDEVLCMYSDYLRLLKLQKLMTIYKEIGTTSVFWNISISI